MQVLALDCSAKAISVAIARDGILIGEGFLKIPLTHSETLMPMCRQVLSNARCTLSDMDALAVTVGPGSFTGIRIGVSAVKGLCFAEQKPVYPFSTLTAMALPYAGGVGFQGILCGLMDARREQFYNALFQVQNGCITRLCDDRLISATALREELQNTFAGQPILLCGDGADLFWRLCDQPSAFSPAPPAVQLQRAAGMAIEASRDKSVVTPVSPEALMPIYLRPSQAERERSEKLKKETSSF